MVVHTCLKCGKQFNHKAPYNYHMFKMKSPCDTNIKKIGHQSSPRNMLTYKCSGCNKTFHNKSNLTRHQRKSCPVNAIDQETTFELRESQLIQTPSQNLKKTDNYMNLKNDKLSTAENSRFYENPSDDSPLYADNKKSHICNYCKKSFTRNYTLQQHINHSCKVKQQHDDEKEEIFQKLIQQMEEQTKEIHQIKRENKQLKQQLSSIIPSGSTNISNTTNANTTNANTTNNTINNNQKIQNIQNNNIQNNIKLVAFGQEDLSYITDNICKQILNKGFRSVPVLIKYTHFNSNKPEQHNVYISNMRDSHAMIYDGKQWKLMDRTEAVDQLIHDGKYYLVEKFEELFEELDPVTIKKFNRFVNQSEDDEILNGLKRDIKYMLYNNKNITERTKSMLCEKQNLFLESSECE